MKSLSPGVTPKALSWEGIGQSEQYVVGLQEIEPKVRFPPTGFRFIIEDTLKLLLKHWNPSMTILGLTKTKYNNPRDRSYYYSWLMRDVHD